MAKAKVVKHRLRAKRLRKREPAPFIRMKLREGTKYAAYDEVAAFGRMLAMRKTAGPVRSALGRMMFGGGIGTGAEYLLGDTGLPPLTLAGVGALGGLAAPLVWKGRRGYQKPGMASGSQVETLSEAAAAPSTSAWVAKRDAVIDKFRQAFQQNRMAAREAWKQYGPQLEQRYGITAAELGL